MTDEPLVLGIETSCDETGVGIVRGHTLLADAVASSVEEHARFGGVVPEVASRAHLEAMVPDDRARRARPPASRLSDIDAVAVTSGPGLAGALLVGVASAKALALGLGKPIYGVNHLAAHVAVDQLEHGPLPEPCLAMLVSGGHSSLLEVTDVTVGVEPMGSTIDDAAGEAFDKVARLLGLPFPGGPHIDKAGAQRQQRRHRLPARAHQPARPRAAPLRLLLLRAQDRRRPLGRGAAARGRHHRRRRRRGVLPGGGLRRADPQGHRRGDQPRDRGHPHRRWRRRQQPAARDGRGAGRGAAASACACRVRACAPTTAPWSPPSGPSSSPAVVRRPRSTCRPTPRNRSRPSSPDATSDLARSATESPEMTKVPARERGPASRTLERGVPQSRTPGATSSSPSQSCS